MGFCRRLDDHRVARHRLALHPRPAVRHRPGLRHHAGSRRGHRHRHGGRDRGPAEEARSLSALRHLLALRHLIEYQLLRLALAFVDRLSLAGAYRLARVLAGLWWRADFPRRRVARENILRGGIETDPGRASALSRRSAEHFGMLVIESLKSAEMLEDDRWREHVKLEIAPDVMAVLEDPEQALIMASGHFGNWEIAAQLLSRYKPVAGITRTMNNPRVEELIQRRKPRYRFHPIPKYAADPRRFLAVLQDREILALLTDQHAHTGGVPIEFFGHPAATYTTAAMLHLVTRAPLCFAACRRLGPMRFELTSSPLIEHRPSGDKKADVRAILIALNGHLEDAIRQAPDQYIWGHRRWRD
ncbi:MAG: lysophospholipid acyltransferase family protein [bacterium]|nr:lysophospholipid acyltransferase family protein [bacterium]